jgi:methyl-accepting chemotaxis protein
LSESGIRIAFERAGGNSNAEEHKIGAKLILIDEVGKLGAALNSMSLKLRDVVAGIQDSAEQVTSSSEEITANAQRLAEARKARHPRWKRRAPQWKS